MTFSHHSVYFFDYFSRGAQRIFGIYDWPADDQIISAGANCLSGV